MKLYLSLLICISSLTCYGQERLKDFDLKRSLKENGILYVFTVLDDEKHGVWKYDREKFYFWYKAQHVLSTQGSSAGKLIHGKLESFYQNKQLESRGQFHKGLKKGEWLYWRPDGTLIKSEEWSKGSQRGLQVFYDEKGIEQESITVHKNKSFRKKGDSLIVSRSNNREEITIYDSIGRIDKTEELKNGALHGKTILYEDGKKMETIKYKKGVAIIKEEREKKHTLKNWFSKLFSKEEKIKKEKTKKTKKKKGE